MTRLLCLLTLFVLPAVAVEVTITAGAQTEPFTVTSDDIAAVEAMRAGRADEDDMCPALKTGGLLHDCSTGTKYIMWKIKQLINHAKKNHPQGADATDAASIVTLAAAIEARKVE